MILYFYAYYVPLRIEFFFCYPSFLLPLQKKRSKEKQAENANFSRFLRLLHKAIASPLHENRLQFAPFSVLPRTTEY
jgi:hypothetical protein